MSYGPVETREDDQRWSPWGTRGRLTGRILSTEILDELRGIVREPSALFFSVLLPVALFTLFVSMLSDSSARGADAVSLMLANFGTYGVLAVTVLTPGVGLARDREIGWLRAKRVSPTPVTVTLAARVVAALPYALTVLLVMTVAATAVGSLDAAPVRLLVAGGILLLGCLPFALLSLAVGLRGGPNGSVAILNAILIPSAVVSGLWMPLSVLPDFFADLARVLPTYHLAQLAVGQVDPTQGGDTAVHVAVLLGTGCVTAGLAALSCRHARL